MRSWIRANAGPAVKLILVVVKYATAAAIGAAILAAGAIGAADLVPGFANSFLWKWLLLVLLYTLAFSLIIILVKWGLDGADGGTRKSLKETSQSVFRKVGHSRHWQGEFLLAMTIITFVVMLGNPGPPLLSFNLGRIHKAGVDARRTVVDDDALNTFNYGDFPPIDGVAQKGEVAGRVVDADGNGVIHADVELTELKTGRVRLKKADADGFFRFADVTPGSFTLSANAPDAKPKAKMERQFLVGSVGYSTGPIPLRVPTEPEGSWFWWKAFVMFLAALIVYAILRLSGLVVKAAKSAWRDVEKNIKQKQTTAAEQAKAVADNAAAQRAAMEDSATRSKAYLIAVQAAKAAKSPPPEPPPAPVMPPPIPPPGPAPAQQKYSFLQGFGDFAIKDAIMEFVFKLIPKILHEYTATRRAEA